MDLLLYTGQRRGDVVRMGRQHVRKGEPFSPAGFTNWFREALTVAGLPGGLSPHGLRKAACRRLAEAGCTPHQIMAISGHRNIMEVMTYTEAANRARLAVEAMATITDMPEAENRTSSVKPGGRV